VRIAGLDLSTARIGYAAPEGGLHSVTARAKADDVPRRLHELLSALERLLRLYPPLPDLVAVEGYSLASPGRISLVRLGELGGAVRLRLFELDVPYVEIPPSSVKRHATGAGNADKYRMTARAIELGARGSVNDDEADAFLLRRMARQAHGLERAELDHERDAIASLSW
jgi:crossover junction endodeoxyribonuclease RuvC